MKHALAGALIVVAHVIAFVALAGRSGPDLEVTIRAPLASPRLSIDGRVPAALADRVTIANDGDGPGLRRRTWTTRYRGGFTRAVGASQLVGPFQDPAKPACSGRVIVGQHMLGGAMARVMAKQIDASLRGQSVFGLGSYEHVSAVTLRWATVEHNPLEKELVAPATGYVRATATVAFSRVRFKLIVALVPYRSGDKLAFHVRPRAEVIVNNVVVQFLSDKLGGDRLATFFAGRQLDDALVTALAPPPPIAVERGEVLSFTYCDDPIEIVDGAYGALPFAVRIARGPGGILPPRFGRGARTPPPADVDLAIDFDVDALDAILHELWRFGWLDRRLAEVGLDRRFAADPLVAELLSIRITSPHLALPPVVEASTDGRLRLAADARLAILDGPALTIGRLFGALRFDVVGTRRLGLAVDLDALELACERTPGVLVPCYADLVAAMRDRGAEFGGALTDAFARVLQQIFANQRVGDRALPVELAIRGAAPSFVREPGKAPTLRLVLDAAIVER